MNVIVSNRQKELIDNANIDAIKDLNGLFNVEDLINKFKNYYFSKMILDATSVVNFASKDVLTTLVNEIGAEKLIILLPSEPEPPKDFLKLLIDLKIYNFTNNIDDVVKFIENPNTYDDVIKMVDDSPNNMYVDNSIKEEDNSNVEEANNGDNGDYSHKSLGEMLNNFNINPSNESGEEASEVEESKEEVNAVEENPIEIDAENTYVDYNNSMQIENQTINSNEKSDKNVFLLFDGLDDNPGISNNRNEKKVIGVKNVTLNAGSTSLVYMMHKAALNGLKKNVLSIEIDKNDFKLYRDNKMICVDGKDVKNVIDNSREDVIFVDLNEYDDTSICTDVLYLIEPSTIKLNKLVIEKKNIFKELKDKKVVLNKSLLSDNDIRTLSSEAGIEFFDNIEPLNDRVFNESIVKLLEQLDIK